MSLLAWLQESNAGIHHESNVDIPEYGGLQESNTDVSQKKNANIFEYGGWDCCLCFAL